ncbi:hypothetical protein [Desulfovibrio cuneatus]|uniref:hypothetical protein n=1 Tax=Desulfovibrio cuneatus TaxID=159728 RepID=UPI00040DDDFD|nr:hypothetical protein [Desulfovibrio cuneatus]
MQSAKRLRSDLYFTPRPQEGDTLEESLLARKQQHAAQFAEEEARFAAALAAAARPDASLVNSKLLLEGLLRQVPWLPAHITLPEKTAPLAFPLPPEPLLAPEARECLESAPEEERQKLGHIPLEPEETRTEDGVPNWISIHSLYNPEEKRRHLEKEDVRQTGSAREKIRNLWADSTPPLLPEQNDNPLQITWGVRLRQLIWWVVLAGAAAVLIKGKGCGVL